MNTVTGYIDNSYILNLKSTVINEIASVTTLSLIGINNGSLVADYSLILEQQRFIVEKTNLLMAFINPKTNVVKELGTTFKLINEFNQSESVGYVNDEGEPVSYVSLIKRIKEICSQLEEEVMKVVKMAH